MMPKPLRKDAFDGIAIILFSEVQEMTFQYSEKKQM